MTKKEKITNEKVKKFLTKTGFLLEMEVVEILKKSGYRVKVNQHFLDLEEGKKREIDIVAEKKINNVNIILTIECKQSFQDSWIFICSEKQPPRYYANLKHLPLAHNLHKSRLFNDTHRFNQKIPLAQNYIVIDKYSEKKSNSLQIDECIYKLPKALIGTAAEISTKDKTIFFPVSVFSGQIFTASYENELRVDESCIVQYNTSLESKFYKKKERNRLLISPTEPDYDGSIYSFESIKPSDSELGQILDISEKLIPRFQIDFVTKDGMISYLNIIEEGVRKISTRKWTYNLYLRPPKLPKFKN